MVQKALNLKRPGNKRKLLFVFMILIHVPFEIIALEVIVETEICKRRMDVNLFLLFLFLFVLFVD